MKYTKFTIPKDFLEILETINGGKLIQDIKSGKQKQVYSTFDFLNNLDMPKMARVSHH